MDNLNHFGDVFKENVKKACPGMLSSENDDFKFLKTAKNIKCTCIMCTIVPGSCNCFISPNKLVVDQKHERNCSQRAVSYIFLKYW